MALGETLFELQARDRMAREAALRQQQQQQSAQTVLQEQAGWDRAFKERDQLHQQAQDRQKMALEWAKLKGQAAGLTGKENEQYDTQEEMQQAEAYRQAAGAEHAVALAKEQAARDAAWRQLGFTQDQANYRAGVNAGVRREGIASGEMRAQLSREQRDALAAKNNALRVRGQNIMAENNQLNRELRDKMFGDTKTQQLGKALEAYAALEVDMKEIDDAVAEAQKSGGDVPGVTPLGKLIPGAARPIIEPLAFDKQGLRVRAATQSLLATFQRVQTGLTSTDRQDAKLALAYMMDADTMDERWLEGAAKVKAIIEKGKAQIKRSYAPDVQAQYERQQNGGATDRELHIQALQQAVEANEYTEEEAMEDLAEWDREHAE